MLATGAFLGTGNKLDNKLVGNTAGNILSGMTGNDTISGGAGSDLLLGGDGNDVIDSGTSNDELIRGAGNDTLAGGFGRDLFRFDTALSTTNNLDRFFDFVSIDDSIQLDNAIFTKLMKTGTLSAANFRASADGTAADANDFILYDNDSGVVAYDADGSGMRNAIAFVTLIGAPFLTAADFIIT